MRSKKWLIYFCLLFIVVVTTALIIRTRRNKSTNETIREINPTYGTIQSLISITGTGQPQNRLEIKPPISGRIEDILVKEGEKVRTGQVLAWMSSTERAALLDTARSQGKEALNYWKEVYKPTPLIAPIDGEVIVRAVEPGQTVTSGDAIIVLSDRLIIKAQADETDVGRIKIGQEAIISLDAYPQIRMEGTVGHISYESKIVNNVTIYEIDIIPKKVPAVFRSGMSANVNIIEAKRENVLIIPLEAVKQDREGSFVFLSQGIGKRPLRQRVKLGISDEKNVEVISGVKPDDKLVILPEKFLSSRTASSTTNPLMPFGGRKR
jgi:macrolide-specific efflux system membrane fusion protein